MAGSVVQSGSNLNMIWLGGTNSACQVLAATNLTPPVVWVSVATNIVGANGLSTNSLLINPNQPMRFYRFMIPYN